ncbi:DUF1800 domain-containing protein [Salinibacterium sp. SWN1162]|uniref:DUF1800 domain-containing protein n=1 Tax=Salinibacterium sp. SWN1162 TaxID=2792053 RepID=UPI0018CD5441|nr:DUF1800 domain-containing protein [Salinibacterium sp. SWN1162]MBH0007745.1 DUF1800 domain-containing protein [Salinibacterium sp. SWN1162]
MNPPVNPDVPAGGEGETLLARRMIITSGVAALAAVGAAAASSAVFGPSIETASSDGLLAPVKPGGSTPLNTPVPTTPTPSATPTGTPSASPSTPPSAGGSGRSMNPPATADPRSPATSNPPADRDQSFAKPGAGSGDAPRADAPSAAKPAAKPTPPRGSTKPESITTAVANNPQTHAHLLSRTTFGPRPSDFVDLSAAGIDSWLGAQLAPASISDPDGDSAWAAFPLAKKSISGVISSVKQYGWDAARETGQATLAAQIFSKRQLFEVVVDVFANLLNVTTPSDSVWATAPDYANSVIRANAFGSYSAMLHAAMRHPAMLTYLNNEQSNKTNVNENLGRELLELHTLGVTSGYTEADVRNSAMILSGRAIDYDTREFRYRPERHFVGPVTTSFFSDENASADGGLEMGDRYVSVLAHHPATAATVVRKLAVRFVSDSPPQALLDRLAQIYLDNDTAIMPVLKELFASAEFWDSIGEKTRRPLEDAVGSARAVNVQRSDKLAQGVKNLYWVLQNLGHAPLTWTPPNGFPDVTGAWLSASQTVARWNLHRGFTGGWLTGLTPPVKLSEAFAPQEGQSYSAWVDAIAEGLIGRPLSAQHRGVLLSYLDVEGSAEAEASNAWQVPALAALVLDSPYFQLR